MDFDVDVEWTERGRPQRRAKRQGVQDQSSKLKSQSFASTKKSTVKKTQVKQHKPPPMKKQKKENSPAKVERPTGYQLLKKNVYIGRKERKLPIEEIPICNCKYSKNKRGCADNACINRALMIECSPKFCQYKELCTNMRFQKRQGSRIKPKKMDKKGWGIVAAENIPGGSFIIEYVGEVIDSEELERRLDLYSNSKHFYCLTLANGETIDACYKGNLSRFINHSCEPNCATQKWQVMGEIRVGIFAKRDISKGEELTFDYQFERVGIKRQRCYCGATSCTKYLGSKSQDQETKFKKTKCVRHQEYADDFIKSLGEQEYEFPFKLVHHPLFQDKKEISDDSESSDSDPKASTQAILESSYYSTTESDIPIFLRRNATRVLKKHMKTYEEMIRGELIKVKKEKEESKMKRIASSDDWSWLKDLNLSKLLKTGGIELDAGFQKTISTRSKK